MKRTVAALALAALLSATLAGCIGDGFGSGGAPRAIVSVKEDPDKQHTYVFDARDSKGKGLTYEWEFGDGTTATDARVEHVYEYGDGVYDARLVIEDSAGTPDVWEDQITVGSGKNQAPVALFKPASRVYTTDEPVQVDASASSDPDGDPVRYRWDFNHLMEFDEYKEFHEAKQAALDGAEEGDDDFSVGGGGDGAEADVPGEVLDRVKEFDPHGLFGQKHAGHGGGGDDIERSLFSHTVETEDPVYTLDEGYPDATTFFIRLQVWDIKGDHEEILSEEIWGVEVYETGKVPKSQVKGRANDTFDLGVPEELEEVFAQTPEDQFTYQTEETFTLDWPIAETVSGQDYLPGGFLNLTWTVESDGLEVPSELEMNVTTPNGNTLGGISSEGSISFELHGQDDHIGDNWDTPWKVEITARSGTNIEWVFNYWVRQVTNPFFEYERARTEA